MDSDTVYRGCKVDLAEPKGSVVWANSRCATYDLVCGWEYWLDEETKAIYTGKNSLYLYEDYTTLFVEVDDNGKNKNIATRNSKILDYAMSHPCGDPDGMFSNVTHRCGLHLTDLERKLILESFCDDCGGLITDYVFMSQKRYTAVVNSLIRKGVLWRDEKRDKYYPARIFVRDGYEDLFGLLDSYMFDEGDYIYYPVVWDVVEDPNFWTTSNAENAVRRRLKRERLV